MGTEDGPRHDCFYYVQKKGLEAVSLPKEEFDTLYRRGEFADGPFIDAFGDRMGEPYNPFRQAFGTLKDGRLVYCETVPRT